MHYKTTLLSKIEKTKNLLKIHDSINTEEFELKDHMRRYIIVRLSGLIEESFADIVAEFLRRKTSEEIARYVYNKVRRDIQNPKPKKIIDILKAFSPELGDNIQNYLTASGIKDNLATLISKRCNISHGKDDNTSIEVLRNYMAIAVELIEYIESQLLS